jgi:hypothetical protein
MGRTYSLNGFLNAALRRSHRTVLVEGPSDKHVLHRIELERFPTKAGGSAIDHAGILDDPLLAGMGNRSKIFAVQAQADVLAASVPKITSVLATLTDREWDGVNFVAFVPNPEWTPPTQQHNRFVTIGHSTENYHFDVECAKEFLKYAVPEHMSTAVLDAIESRFPAIIAFAAVFWLKVRDDSCISRCAGLITPSHIDIRNDRVYLNPSFAAACAGRQFSSAASIVLDTNLAIDGAWADLVGKDFTRWLPHGHIGDEMLWCGVAKVAMLHGVAEEVCNEIAHGYKKELERFKAQWLSKLTAATCTPLGDAVAWLHRQV